MRIMLRQRFCTRFMSLSFQPRAHVSPVDKRKASCVFVKADFSRSEIHALRPFSGPFFFSRSLKERWRKKKYLEKGCPKSFFY
jgi:hypothetical protein